MYTIVRLENELKLSEIDNERFYIHRSAIVKVREIIERISAFEPEEPIVEVVFTM